MTPYFASRLATTLLLVAWTGDVARGSQAAATSRPTSVLAGFVENCGQWSPDVLFHAQTPSGEVTVRPTSIVLQAPFDPRIGVPLASSLVLRFVGASDPRSVEGLREVPTRHHFLLGDVRARDVRGFETVVYHGLLPGVDVALRCEDGEVAYDLLLEAGADLADVVVEVEGADRLELLAPDRLAIHAPNGVVEHTIGATWQQDPESGARDPLVGRFRMLEDERGRPRFGFDAPGWDGQRALVLDPSLAWATYLGGSFFEKDPHVAVSQSGEVYLCCDVAYGSPTTPGSFQPFAPGYSNAWVGKLSPDGTTLEWGTFLGGSDTDGGAFGLSMAVDQDGTVVVAGCTWSSDFPTTPESLQPKFASLVGTSDFFVTRLSADGSSIVWSTYFGGLDYENSGDQNSLALTPSGDVVMSGNTRSALPATPGAFDPVADLKKEVIFKLSADGTQLEFLTYFKVSRILDLAIDGESNIVFAGSVGILDLPIPVTPGAFQETTSALHGEAYVAKLNATGTQLLFSTYLGGEDSNESVWGLDVDAAGAVYVAGQANSDDFPMTPGAFDTVQSAPVDGFVTKLLPHGTGLVWSTYLGSGPAGGGGYTDDIAVDAAGNAHVSGSANEPGWPVTPDALQKTYLGVFPSSDAAYTKLDAFGEKLVYSTWFAGHGTDYFTQIALDGLGNPVLAFETYSFDLLVTPGAYQSVNQGWPDLAIAKFEVPLAPWRVLGGGLKGAKDTPNLAGGGPLTPGTPTRLSIRGAAPAAPAWIVAGFSQLSLPILGGTLVPAPHVIVPVGTSGTGALDFTFPWPGLAPATTVTFQVWVADVGAPQGWSATNAVEAITP